MNSNSTESSTRKDTLAVTDATHSPALRSWVPSANVAGIDFPIQNLPLGRFRPPADEVDGSLRVGVAIGDQVLDLKKAAEQCPWAEDRRRFGVRPLLPLRPAHRPAQAHR